MEEGGIVCIILGSCGDLVRGNGDWDDGVGFLCPCGLAKISAAVVSAWFLLLLLPVFLKQMAPPKTYMEPEIVMNLLSHLYCIFPDL